MGDPQHPKIGGELLLELINKLVQKKSTEHLQIFPSQPKMWFSAEIVVVFSSWSSRIWDLIYFFYISWQEKIFYNPYVQNNEAVVPLGTQGGLHFTRTWIRILKWLKCNGKMGLDDFFFDFRFGNMFNYLFQFFSTFVAKCHPQKHRAPSRRG